MCVTVGTTRVLESLKHRCREGGGGCVLARLGGCAGARDAEAQRWRGQGLGGGAGGYPLLPKMSHKCSIIYTTLRNLLSYLPSFSAVSVLFVVLGIKSNNHQLETPKVIQ